MVLEYKYNKRTIDLGKEEPSSESFLHSPTEGIDILEDENTCNISSYIKQKDGINSWVENI